MAGITLPTTTFLVSIISHDVWQGDIVELITRFFIFNNMYDSDFNRNKYVELQLDITVFLPFRQDCTVREWVLGVLKLEATLLKNNGNGYKIRLDICPVLLI